MNVKINEDEFLGKQELNRFKKSIFANGYQKIFQQSVKNYGVVNLPSDIGFNNLRIVQGTAINKLTLKTGVAIDGNLSIITAPSDQVDILTTPTNNVFRYIKISYLTSNYEVGTLSIAANGTLTGTGTKFTEVLRGSPNFPTKVRFPTSSGNTLEYEVLSVTNDTTAVLNGSSFTAESSLQYVAVGTFTPGITIPPGNKDIYQYDYYTIVLSSSSSLSSNQYLLAKVKSDGVTTTIIDLRNSNLFMLNDSAPSLPLLTKINPLIGIENAKFNTIYNDRSSNLIRIAWGYKSLTGNWTVDLTNNKITINSGSGGVFAGNVNVLAGHFNGWRVYFDNGLYGKIITQTKSGTDVILNLQEFDANNFPSTGTIVVVPDADDIEIRIDGTTQLKAEDNFLFNISTGYAIIPIRVAQAVAIKWKNILKGTTMEFTPINDGDYFIETDFDNNGNQILGFTSTVTGGLFLPMLSPDNFKDKKASLDSDNTFTGINYFQKQLSINKGSDIDISLSPNGNHKSLVLNEDGNYMYITDTSVFGILESIIAPTLGNPVINIDFGSTIVMKYNVTINATDYSNGYRNLQSLSSTDVTFNTRDIGTFMFFGGSWYLINIFRTQDTQNPLNAFDQPILGLDNQCIVPIDNKLGNILEAIISTLCNMSSGNQFGFKSNKTAIQEIIYNTAPFKLPIIFEDDGTSPYFDNGNDFYVDRYITPKADIRQKFILENVGFYKGPTFTAGGGSGSGLHYVEFAIVKNATYYNNNGDTDGTILSYSRYDFTSGFSTGTTHTDTHGGAGGTGSHLTGDGATGGATPWYFPSLTTDYVTLIEGDVIQVFMGVNDNGGGIKYFEFSAGSKFSNSF